MILTVKVRPNAKNSRIISWQDASTIIVDIAAPAKDGKANRALINLLAQELGVAKSLIAIKRGHAGKVKHVELPDDLRVKK